MIFENVLKEEGFTNIKIGSKGEIEAEKGGKIYYLNINADKEIGYVVKPVFLRGIKK